MTKDSTKSARVESQEFSEDAQELAEWCEALQSLVSHSGPERARQILDQESIEPLELTKGLPGRFCVIRISNVIHVAVLTFYHGLIDGIGLSIVFEELSVAYAALSSGRRPRLKPVEVQSLDYSSWLKSWLEANNARLESFWKNVYREGIPKN